MHVHACKGFLQGTTLEARAGKLVFQVLGLNNVGKCRLPDVQNTFQELDCKLGRRNSTMPGILKFS